MSWSTPQRRAAPASEKRTPRRFSPGEALAQQSPAAAFARGQPSPRPAPSPRAPAQEGNGAAPSPRARGLVSLASLQNGMKTTPTKSRRPRPTTPGSTRRPTSPARWYDSPASKLRHQQPTTPGSLKRAKSPTRARESPPKRRREDSACVPSTAEMPPTMATNCSDSSENEADSQGGDDHYSIARSLSRLSNESDDLNRSIEHDMEILGIQGATVDLDFEENANALTPFSANRHSSGQDSPSGLSFLNNDDSCQMIDAVEVLRNSPASCFRTKSTPARSRTPGSRAGPPSPISPRRRTSSYHSTPRRPQRKDSSASASRHLASGAGGRLSNKGSPMASLSHSLGRSSRPVLGPDTPGRTPSRREKPINIARAAPSSKSSSTPSAMPAVMRSPGPAMNVPRDATSTTATRQRDLVLKKGSRDSAGEAPRKRKASCSAEVGAGMAHHVAVTTCAKNKTPSRGQGSVGSGLREERRVWRAHEERHAASPPRNSRSQGNEEQVAVGSPSAKPRIQEPSREEPVSVLSKSEAATAAAAAAQPEVNQTAEEDGSMAAAGDTDLLGALPATESPKSSPSKGSSRLPKSSPSKVSPHKRGNRLEVEKAPPLQLCHADSTIDSAPAQLDSPGRLAAGRGRKESLECGSEPVDSENGSPGDISEAQPAFQGGIPDDFGLQVCRNQAVLQLKSTPSSVSCAGLVAQRNELANLVRAAVENGESGSVLVFGQRGSGKAFLVDMAVRKVREELGHVNFRLVKLMGNLFTDDLSVIREISRQLSLADAARTVGERHAARFIASESSKLLRTGNFSQHLALLRTMLREGSREGPMRGGIPLVIVLDRFELFTKRSKQTLLYNLADLTQAPNTRIVIIGLTDQLNVASSLEKRVKSRFDSRHLYLPQPAFADLQTILSERLQVASELPMANEWNARIHTMLHDDRAAMAEIQRMALLGHSTGRILRLVLQALKNGAPRATDQVLAAKDLAHAETHLHCDLSLPLLPGLDMPEQVLLVAMMHLERTQERATFNFEMIFAQSQKFYSKAGTLAQRVSKGRARKAFEHLLEIRLASQTALPLDDCSGVGRTHIPFEFRAVRLLVSPDAIAAAISRGTLSVPTQVQQWAQEAAST